MLNERSEGTRESKKGTKKWSKDCFDSLREQVHVETKFYNDLMKANVYS